MLVEGEVIEKAEHKIPKGGEGGKGKLRIYCVEKGGKVLDGWIRWQTRMFFSPTQQQVSVCCPGQPQPQPQPLSQKSTNLVKHGPCTRYMTRTGLYCG